MRSQRYHGLFDPRIVVRTAPVDAACLDGLLPQERAAVATAGAKRQREYATARVVAREALSEMGVAGFALLNGEDRAPRWPAGIAGSISHCNSRVFVAVARRDELGTVGVDVEHRNELKRELWRMTLLPQEQAWLEERAESERGRLALVAFGAKEALYKAQYPHSQQYMGFMALRVHLEPDGDAPLERGVLRCVFQNGVGPFPSGFVAMGRYQRVSPGRPEVVSAVRIPPLQGGSKG